MRNFLIIAFTFSCIFVKAIPIDSTLYSNDFERQIFEKYKRGEKPVSLKMLACFYYKEEDFQIKLIYKNVHSPLSKKYMTEVFFKDLLKHGQHNYLTSTVFYALLLGNYKIEHQIKETPNHLYPIAEPLRYNVLMESTNPKNGLQVMSEDYKRKYIGFLADNKIIDQEEMESESIYNLFETYRNKDI